MFIQQRGNEAAPTFTNGMLVYEYGVVCMCVSRGFAKWSSIYIIKKFLLKLTFLLEDDLLKFCLNGFDVSFILAEKKR